MIYFVSRIVYKLILKFFFKFKIIGKENIPKKGPFILVSNHISYADPAVMGVTCYTVPVTFMAKLELFDKSFFGKWVKAAGCIPIARHSGGAKSLKDALKKLKEGGVLGIFPEGTRSLDGNLQKAEPGVGFLAAKSKVPIIPMYIFGTDKILPKGQKHLSPGEVTAKVGKPVNIKGNEEFIEKKKMYEFIGERIMSAIGELKNE